MALIIVWSPMMPGDSEGAARESAAMFDTTRVVQFYDPNRRVGDAFRRDVFPDAYDKAFNSLPKDHWLRESLPLLEARYRKSPERDIYMFFAPGLEWKKAPARPTRYVRHLGRIIEHDHERLSLMWVDDYANPPVEGQLPDEVSKLARDLTHKRAKR